ncbi:hypothetical protein [Pseudomonas amygdali]|uniref:PH domain-containing protein n=2 Tax=Pseudomonas amygdali pv. lachrymans TaxID=53707 RepID=A0ABR5KSS6_PSEAV|nr:hypothetical protein [Pseudomonas amygdali]AXH60274.1 hypothetical protein PLA107_034380 [Pseudomonas amygdali pv. lachrymans str. M301315]KPC17663.1 Uncharacterized protein AC499_0865 [Pseudomonas amygdali pv. lachrymans]RMT06415.1 hypothetical protein ALP54_04093 [Pseudomonas amygdali pv. lachrymans]
MTTPYEFELNCFDIAIQNPEKVESWIEGLKPVIEQLADENSITQFTRRDDISADDHKKIGTAFHDAMKNYRGKVEGNRPFKDYLTWALNDVWGDEANDWYTDNISLRPVDDLYDELDQIMSECGGPVADIDEVIEQMGYAMEEIIRDNDDSTCLDMFSGHAVRLNFNPFYSPFEGGVDDLIFYQKGLANDLEAYDAKSLIDFLRLDKKQVLSMLGLNYKDTDGIRNALDSLRTINHDLPSLVTTDELSTLLDSLGGSCAYPHWYGVVDFDDLFNCDPDKPMRLKGGVIAFLDVINGSGDYVSLPEDRFVVITPGQYPSPKYWSYDCDSIFGGSRAYEATLKPFNLEIYQSMEIEKKKQRMLGLADLRLG